LFETSTPPVLSAVELRWISNAGISALPILDETWKPIAVVTDQDVIAANLKGLNTDCGRGPDQIPLPEVMSPWPPVVDPDTLVADAARMMSYLDIKRVFVVDQDKVVGVLSQADIVDALATADGVQTQTGVVDVCQPSLAAGRWTGPSARHNGQHGRQDHEVRTP
jgi:CBS domain-containing protein